MMHAVDPYRRQCLSRDMGDAGCLGPRLRLEVERQLFDDLRFYGIPTDGLSIDWSETCPEGRRVHFLDGELENWSDVGVTDAGGALVAGGWIDFVEHGQNLIVYWDSLSRWVDGRRTDLKKEFGLPAHVQTTIG